MAAAPKANVGELRGERGELGQAGECAGGDGHGDGGEEDEKGWKAVNLEARLTLVRGEPWCSLPFGLRGGVGTRKGGVSSGGLGLCIDGAKSGGGLREGAVKAGRGAGEDEGAGAAVEACG